MEVKKIITNERRFYPLLVSGVGLERQTDNESDQVWEQLDKIPENNKKILLSSSIIESLYQAEQKFGWEPYCSARLAYFVRELFFQTISQSEFYRAAEALFRPKYQDRYNEILTYINNAVLTAQPDQEEEEDHAEEQEKLREEGSVKQHALLDAMGRYPGLASQSLTENAIKLKSQATLVRPTISNWLKNYRDEIGIGKHDAVARANFLFESVNTKKLSSKERERLHAIVRSLEDGELLDIDVKHQVILFQKENRPVRSEAPTSLESEKPSPDIFERFQNISVQPPEELKNVGTQTFVNSKVVPEKQSIPSKVPPVSVKNFFAVPHNDAAGSSNISGVPVNEPSAPPISPGSPLGTVRFSAKHILPAEKYEVENYAELPVDPRLQHFRPKEQVLENSLPPAPPVASVPMAPPLVQPVPLSVAEITQKLQRVPQSKPPAPSSIFRIKPSKE